jgi:hypothetical protein
MNPNAVNRVAIAAAVSAVVLVVAVASGGRRCQQAMPAMQAMPPVQVAVDVANEERATVEMARADAEVARAEAESVRLSAETDREAAMRAELAAHEEAVEVMDREDDLNKVRQAAKDYIKSKYPDSKADGIFLLPLYQDSLFIAGVDTQFSNGVRGTVDLLVRRYVRKANNGYWRAESLDGGQSTIINTKK